MLALINAGAAAHQQQPQRPLSLSLSLRRLQIWPKANNIGANDIAAVVAELSQNGEKDDEDDESTATLGTKWATTTRRAGWLALDSIIDAQTSIRSSPKISK